MGITDLFSEQSQRELREAKINFFEEIKKEENFAGSLYDLDYEEAKILVNDFDKNSVKGLPHGCLLVAIYNNELRQNQTEAILLRVIGVCEIPQKKEIIQSMTDSYISKKENRANTDPDIYTKYFYQFSGLSCRVLGTFFLNKDKKLIFGTDIENFLGAHNYRVYKPQKQQLQIIVNENTESSNNETQEKIGILRYASSQSYDEDKNYAPDVFLRTNDIVARRTAFFGMTRTGKSNTIKIIISAIENLNVKQERKIGQIIFDVNGEYTFSNRQDEGSIYDRFKQRVIRFSTSLKKSQQHPDVRAVQYNFYNDETLEESFNLLCDELENNMGGTKYIDAFRNVSLFDIGDKYSSKERNRLRKIALYKCILFNAKFSIAENYKLFFSGIDGFPIPKNGFTIREAMEWFEKAEESLKKGQSSSGEKYWDSDYESLYNMLFKRQGAGFNSLLNFNKLHSLKGGNDYKKDIDSALREGKIILVDLSTASTETQQKYIDRLCSHIFAKSMEKFTNDEEPEFIQMYFEEAHNIFPKDDKDLKNIYNRLAKEGAKLKIGISYSTQEVSSIAPSILKNTQNWFISHLNNKDEIKALEKYYDFADFSQNIIRNSDVGFARVKTYSNNFIVPVQIQKFEVRD
ncbi:ATP-binding protein [Helicobacter japonicus]|uniref:ATP-binding protein n=2 Tax=Helicobacter japonicus TaxID=425400 RepID=UPI003013E933